MSSKTVKPTRVHARGARCYFRIAGAIAIGLALGACGGEGKPKNPGQAVARVNSTEITIHEVNNELARMGVPGGGANQQAAKRALDMLVDQQLLVQQATQSKLDRDPQVMQALEQARRRLLSEAYLERNLSVPRPTPEEVKKFYADNPALFEKRRVYTFQDFVIERAQFSDALRRKLDGAKVPADVLAALKAANVSYREASTRRGAEQLPIDMLPRVAAMAKGDISVIPNDNSVVMMQLIDSSEQPIALPQATPYIEQYLVNSKKRQMAESRIKELRAAAKIAYLGTFEEGAAPPQAKTQPQPPAGTPAADAAKPSAETQDEGLRKGLKGLIGK